MRSKPKYKTVLTTSKLYILKSVVNNVLSLSFSLSKYFIFVMNLVKILQLDCQNMVSIHKHVMPIYISPPTHVNLLK